ECEYGDLFNFIHSDIRLGIAKAKNVCLDNLKGCDYIFLFDDDCFPKRFAWEDCYISASSMSGVEYMNWMRPDVPNHLFVKNEYQDIIEYNNCMGVLQFFTKNAAEILEGFDERFLIYGFEHAEIANRAFTLELTNGYGPYIAPLECNDYIYTIDMDYDHLKVPIPLGGEIICRSSLSAEEKDIYIKENSKVFEGIINARNK
ncbi:MAG TPA: glycosyltransferase family A protein, partial [Clostridia bacterium]